MKTEVENILSRFMNSWDLQYDGDGFYTHSSFIQPVLLGNVELILKIPFTEDEKAGIKVLQWWDGVGAAKVIKSDDDAILMERISGDLSLMTMSLNGNDDEATGIICEVANQLHSRKKELLPQLTPLSIWFEELFSSADKYGDVFLKSASIAKALLKSQTNIGVLHGDLHHKNILYSSERGWLAIDPKGLLGDKAYDYVNILCNPTKGIALAEGRFIKHIGTISRNTGIETNHLLKWTAAFAGLSAVWSLNEGQEAHLRTEVLKLAVAQLP